MAGFLFLGPQPQTCFAVSGSSRRGSLESFQSCQHALGASYASERGTSEDFPPLSCGWDPSPPVCPELEPIFSSREKRTVTTGLRAVGTLLEPCWVPGSGPRPLTHGDPTLPTRKPGRLWPARLPQRRSQQTGLGAVPGDRLRTTLVGRAQLPSGYLRHHCSSHRSDLRREESGAGAVLWVNPKVADGRRSLPGPGLGTQERASRGHRHWEGAVVTGSCLLREAALQA